MRRMIAFLVPFVTALIVAPFAFAAWMTTGIGSGTATATSVNAGNSPSPEWGDGTVLLSWDASTLASGAAVGSYDVIRFNGETSSPVCEGETGTSCTDSDPLPGPVSYVVVPRIGAHWEGAPSAPTPFQYDVFAPTTLVSMRTPDANDAGWNKDDVTITLEATDPAPVASGVKEIHYVLNGVETTVSDDQATFTVSQEQVNALKYWAVDNLDNTEGETPTNDVKVDKTAPVTTALTSPTPNTAGWSNTDVSVSLNASDVLSGVSSTEYSLTGGATWTPYTVPVQVTTEGTHAVTYRSTDRAGNVESSKTETVKLDKRAPESSGSLSGSTVTLSATDVGPSGVASIVYKIGAAASYTSYTGPFALASGETVTFHALDEAGNVESPDKTLTSAPSDTTGPVISSILPASLSSWTNVNPGGTWSSVCTSGRVCATANDDGSAVDDTRVTFKLTGTSGLNNGKCWDGGNFVTSTTTCTRPMTLVSGSQYGGASITRNKMNAGTYSLLISAFDVFGNETTATVTFSVTGNP